MECRCPKKVINFYETDKVLREIDFQVKTVRPVLLVDNCRRPYNCVGNRHNYGPNYQEPTSPNPYDYRPGDGAHR